MKTFLAALLILLPQIAYSQNLSDRTARNDLNVREPFMLKLPIDRESYYEKPIPASSFVEGKAVYILPEEHFGVSVRLYKRRIRSLSYERNVKGADVEFKFSRWEKGDGKTRMLLVIKNRLNRTLQLRALMAVPMGRQLYQTSIIPVQPGIESFEDWPHPIVGLVLHDLKLKGSRRHIGRKGRLPISADQVAAMSKAVGGRGAETMNDSINQLCLPSVN